MNQKMPVLFVGHGSPMLALDHNAITKKMFEVGNAIVQNYGTPKAILAISGHWFTNGTFVQSAQIPNQIYDMYGFPQELYEIKYPVKGNTELTEAVLKLLAPHVRVDDSWGIDHGTWSVLHHMFPLANIPTVQLSIDGNLTAGQYYEIGKKLAPLREQGFLVFGSGAIVHNLREVNPYTRTAAPESIRFNEYIVQSIIDDNASNVIEYINHPDAGFAVPTPDHYVPLLYCLGAADGDHASVFNNAYQFGSTALTSFLFGFEETVH